MRYTAPIVGIGLAVIGGGLLIEWGRHSPALAASPEAPRQAVELTVYPDDFGMVHETRPVHMDQGSNRLRLPDVSRELDPQSVLMGWQDNRQGLPQLVANSYDLGVQNSDELLKRYLGHQVEVVRYGSDGHEAEREQGALMVQDGGKVVLERDGKFIIDPHGALVAPADPDVVTIPQLSVQADSASAQTASLNLAYLTRGLSWSADYVAILSPQGASLDLQSWATVTNRTGVDYPDAKVSLVAGSPNRAVVSGRMRADIGLVETANASFSTDGGRRAQEQPKMVAAPEAVGDNYIYPINGRATVVQERMNRLLMLESANVSVIKDYSTRPPGLGAYDNGDWGTPATPGRGHVQVAITFANAKKEGLGQPLPHGALRIYEPDASGTLRYAGAADVQDTPTDQKVNVTLAQAFDLFTDWSVKKVQQFGKHRLRKQIELTLHNEKTEPVDLRVAQELDGRWKIVTESLKHRSIDAQNAQWVAHVPAKGSTTLTYTVDFTL